MNKNQKTASKKNKPNTSCSVVVCVYEKDNAEHFRAAVESLYNQTLLPGEVVIAGDGKLSDELYKTVDTLKKKYHTLKYFELDKNRGIGAASNFGISKCQNDLVAKMDSDDISVPTRIEKQVKAFQDDPELVMLGGQIEEFKNNDPKQVVSRREVPTDSDQIIKFARRRSPLNNPTIMFRKKEIETVGGYPEMSRAEDYYLFIKLIAAKKKLANLSDVLVKYRLDADNIKRRKSWANTKEMILARREAYKLGVARWSDYMYMKCAFIALFIMPSSWAEKLYQKRLRK
ncbi:glycosyltransferase [Candidatus Saccharibacteria bacterium]|nr:glycosyltransferase [Candidatus Saccharibacteria bacterium]